MTSTSKKEPTSKLDELAQMKAERAAARKRPEPPPQPPTQDLQLTFINAEGGKFNATLQVRVFNRDEMMDVHRLAALYAGIDFDLLGRDAQDICLARAMVEVMWKDKVPEWLKTAMAQDESLAVRLATAINSHRTAYFRGDYRTSTESKEATGLEIIPVRPANPKEK